MAPKYKIPATIPEYTSKEAISNYSGEKFSADPTIVIYSGEDPRTPDESKRDYTASTFMTYRLFEEFIQCLPCTKSQFIHKMGVTIQAVNKWKLGGDISVYSEKCILFTAEQFRQKLIQQKAPTLIHYTLEELILHLNLRGYEVSITSKFAKI